MTDPTEESRMSMVRKINSKQANREELEQAHGQVWDTKELQEDFEVQNFLAPFVIVRRKSDSHKGALMFQHGPRFYFDFQDLNGENV